MGNYMFIHIYINVCVCAELCIYIFHCYLVLLQQSYIVHSRAWKKKKKGRKKKACITKSLKNINSKRTLNINFAVLEQL